ncbi:MAG: sigma-54-dependent Fis family transcriptional regulator [Opitutaceae bacterium]|nr:sigma-54-dependent Fis family transcriptional regulator [Opitutaceae bacterium]
MRILLLGDDAKNRRLLAFGLALADDEPATAGSASDLMRIPDLRLFDVALIDWESRSEPAVHLLDVLRRLAPGLPVIACTTTPERAAGALAAGAVDVLIKPVDIDAARTVLSRHARGPAGGGFGLARSSNGAAEPTATAADAFDSLSPSHAALMGVVARVAPTAASVLILGENGTGKSRLARLLHDRSPRRERAFLTVNCPCLQPQLLESELFGHVRGAFTGAVSDATGKIAAAEGGTLFLDEIGELPLSIQPKLLRLLQERLYERVGDSKSREANIRVVAATNRDLKTEVAMGRFREDLYYRLNVISLVVPALRHRPEDVVPMAEHFLLHLGRAHGRQHRGFTRQAREALLRHLWPGNLRELRNTVERAAILCDREWIDLEDLPELDPGSSEVLPQVGDFVTLEALEQAHIQRVIARTESLGQAARVLGIDKATLYRRRKRTGSLGAGEDKLDEGTLRVSAE